MIPSTRQSRYARWWAPAWPVLGAFFAGAFLLSLIAHSATDAGTGAAEANWAALASDLAVGVIGAVLAGIAFGFAAAAAVCAELGVRRHSHGARSLSIFLLAVISACSVMLIASAMSIDAHSVYGLRDRMDPRIMPVLLFALVAWPLGHLVGLGYGLAAQCRRREQPWLGLIGICLNLLALPVWYVTVLDPLPAAAIF